MILAFAAALAFEPFAVGSATDIRQLAAMAQRCHIPARQRRVGTAYALDLPEDVAGASLGSPRAECLLGRMSAHRFSAQFATIGNAGDEAPGPISPPR